MVHRFQDTRRWVEEGTQLLLATASSLSETAYREPSTLPGWDRGHVLAHLAANADALSNLVRGAATGESIPMYSSGAARAEAIADGAQLPAAELLGWLDASSGQLERGMNGLSSRQWQTTVVTAQGRTVPATEIPWLRAREVFVHLVDLSVGVPFSALPDDLLDALRDDITTKRSAAGEELPPVTGSAADVTAFLAGRPHGPVKLSDGMPASALGPWL